VTIGTTEHGHVPGIKIIRNIEYECLTRRTPTSTPRILAVRPAVSHGTMAPRVITPSRYVGPARPSIGTELVVLRVVAVYAGFVLALYAGETSTVATGGDRRRWGAVAAVSVVSVRRIDLSVADAFRIVVASASIVSAAFDGDVVVVMVFVDVIGACACR